VCVEEGWCIFTQPVWCGIGIFNKSACRARLTAIGGVIIYLGELGQTKTYKKTRQGWAEVARLIFL
jgi:hypothetical protein